VKQRILVVEDHPINRELLLRMLETEGYEVTSAESFGRSVRCTPKPATSCGAAGYTTGRRGRATLATWIRQQPTIRDIPVIAVTAHAMAAEWQRILQAGCNSCIAKPIDFKMLQNQLDNGGYFGKARRATHAELQWRRTPREMKVWLRFLSSKMRVIPIRRMDRESSALFPRVSWPAIRRDDTVHPQVFHKLAVVIKAMSDRIHCERKRVFCH